MSLSTYYLEYGRHVTRLCRRRRRCRRVYAAKSNTTIALITMRKSTHGFPFLSYMSMGRRLEACSGRSSAINLIYYLIKHAICKQFTKLVIPSLQVNDKEVKQQTKKQKKTQKNQQKQQTNKN